MKIRKDRKITKKEFAFIVFSAVFGALCVGIGDLLINGDTSTVVKMADIMYMYLGAPNNACIALLLLMLLGAGLCIVRQPKTRIDSFAIGLSIFAALTLTPYQDPDKPSNATIANNDPQITITFEYAETVRETPEYAVVKLIEGNTRRSISKRFVPSTEDVRLDLDPGDYRLEVEASGIRTVSARLIVGDSNASYTLPLEGSGMPVNLQKLYSPNEVQLKPQ
jgi:hypothetical protein